MCFPRTSSELMLFLHQAVFLYLNPSHNDIITISNMSREALFGQVLSHTEEWSVSLALFLVIVRTSSGIDCRVHTVSSTLIEKVYKRHLFSGTVISFSIHRVWSAFILNFHLVLWRAAGRRCPDTSTMLLLIYSALAIVNINLQQDNYVLLLILPQKLSQFLIPAG